MEFNVAPFFFEVRCSELETVRRELRPTAAIEPDGNKEKQIVGYSRYNLYSQVVAILSKTCRRL